MNTRNNKENITDKIKFKKQTKQKYKRCINDEIRNKGAFINITNG